MRLNRALGPSTAPNCIAAPYEDDRPGTSRVSTATLACELPVPAVVHHWPLAFVTRTSDACGIVERLVKCPAPICAELEIEADVRAVQRALMDLNGNGVDTVEKQAWID